MGISLRSRLFRRVEKCVSIAANFVAIFVGFIAFWAWMYPASVSGYLEQVAAASERSADSLESIAVDTPEIANNTRDTAESAAAIEQTNLALADALSFWPTTTMRGTSILCGDTCVVAPSSASRDNARYFFGFATFDNPGNRQWDVVSVKLLDEMGVSLGQITNRVLAPNESLEVRFNTNTSAGLMPAFLCTELLDIRRKQRGFESRRIVNGSIPRGQGQYIEFSERAFSTEKAIDICE